MNTLRITTILLFAAIGSAYAKPKEVTKAPERSVECAQTILFFSSPCQKEAVKPKPKLAPWTVNVAKSAPPGELKKKPLAVAGLAPASVAPQLSVLTKKPAQKPAVVVPVAVPVPKLKAVPPEPIVLYLSSRQDDFYFVSEREIETYKTELKICTNANTEVSPWVTCTVSFARQEKVAVRLHKESVDNDTYLYGLLLQKWCKSHALILLHGHDEDGRDMWECAQATTTQ